MFKNRVAVPRGVAQLKEINALDSLPPQKRPEENQTDSPEVSNPTLRLWQIWQDVNTGYGTYDSAVVAAATEDDARRIHPSEYASSGWGELNGLACWRGQYDAPNRPEIHGKLYEYGGNCWAGPEHVKVKLIGDAAPGIKPGRMCGSFNAG